MNPGIEILESFDPFFSGRRKLKIKSGTSTHVVIDTVRENGIDLVPHAKISHF